MLTGVVKDTGGLFDRRFVLNALLPVLIALCLLAAVVIGTSADPAAVLRSWNKLDGTVRALACTGALIVAVVLAAVFSGRSHSLVRCYEGQWPGRLGAAATSPGRRWHHRRARRLGFDRAASDYPPDPADIMPTRLGNILRTAESYPQDRYGLDAVLTWPRLFPLLPAKISAALVAARAEVEFHLTISALSFLFAVCSGAWLVGADGPTWLFLTCYWGGAATAWLTYCGALTPARLYADQVRVAFDLYRQDLLVRVGIDIDDHEQWIRLNQFWHRNIPLDTPLDPQPTEAQPEEPSGPPIPLQLIFWTFIISTGLAITLPR